MDYAAFKASLGIKPTQLDTGFQDCHTAHVAAHVPDLINRRASSSARKTLRAMEDLSHLNPSDGHQRAKKGWWKKLSPERQQDILRRRRATLAEQQ